jgi:hypothetical protein
MNPNMANMNPMGGPVGGAPVSMMNNGAINPQGGPGPGAPRQQQVNDNQRGVLNTYIYEYFIRYGMYECARSLLSSDQQVNVHKDGKGGSGVNGAGDDSMDTDHKEDLDSKLPDDLPPPKLPMPASDTSFLYEWFCLFWDIYNAQRQKSGNAHVNQYVNHTQVSNCRLFQTPWFRLTKPLSLSIAAVAPKAESAAGAPSSDATGYDPTAVPPYDANAERYGHGNETG